MARRGFVVDDTFASQTEDNVPWFDDVPSTAKLYLDADGTPRDIGSVLRNPDLASTYRRIARGGAGAFYSGPVADAIVDAARRPPIAPTADHAWRPGLLTRSDVAAYTAPERKPTHVRHRGLDVWSMGPPSSGGSTVGEALNILAGYPDLGADRTRALHLFLEASRLSFADRNAFLGDPAFVDVPLDALLSRGFAAQRRALIDPEHAGTSPAPPGQPEGSTTHLVVSDRHGTVVSYTFTIESIGGNGIVVPGYGFLLNNELTDFNYDATDEPNSADGRKRPRSSMAPTIVTRRGKPFLAVGSPGGASIITTVLQVLLDRLDLGSTLPEAIAAPRASQRNSETTEAEPAFIASPEGQALQSRYGQVLEPVEDPGELGAVTGIEQLDGGRRARRGRAGAPRWRQRGGRAPVEFRGVRPRTRTALALGCLATVAAADLTLHRRKPPWIVVGLFDHPAHLATGALVALNVRGRPKRWRQACLAGSLIADVDHIPLALRPELPTTGRPAPGQPLPAGGRAGGGRRRAHPERAPARAGRRHARPLPARPRRGQRRAAAVAGDEPLAQGALRGLRRRLRAACRPRRARRAAIPLALKPAYSRSRPLRAAPAHIPGASGRGP